MEFLPIILKKGQPFLAALSGTCCRQRALFPSGRLVSFLDPGGRLRVYYLLSKEGVQTVSVDAGKQFME